VISQEWLKTEYIKLQLSANKSYMPRPLAQ